MPMIRLMPVFEKLNRALVLFGLFARIKRTKVLALARARIGFSGIEPILP